MAFATGCASLIGGKAADTLSAVILNQDDPALIESGVPAYLLAIDGLISQHPDNIALLSGGAQLFAFYGSSFVPPKYAGSVTLGGRFFDQALTIGARLTFAGERAADATLNSVTLPYVWEPYAIVDLFGSYKFAEEATLNFSAENLGDRYYVDALGNAYMPAPGRTIRSGMTLRF